MTLLVRGVILQATPTDPNLADLAETFDRQGLTNRHVLCPSRTKKVAGTALYIRASSPNVEEFRGDGIL